MSAERQKVHGIVLAGAHAWGESILERVCPRPLLPVAGRPLIWFALDWLRRSGLSDVTVCANSDTHVLRNCLGDGATQGLSLDYYEDVMPRGPAGCARDAAYQTSGDLFVVVEAMILPRIDLADVLAEHLKSRSALTVVATRPGSGGDERALEPAGVYVVSKSALELIPSKGYQDIKEMWIPRLYQHGCPATPHLVGEDSALRVSGIGSYLAASALAIEVLSGGTWLRRDYRQIGSAWVHRTAQLADSTRISGNVLVGPQATVESGAALIGPSVIGPDSRIEASAVVSHAIAWSDCRIGRGAILNRCILLNGSCVEPELVVRDTVWFAETVSSPLSGDRASYWALRESPVDVPGVLSNDEPEADDGPAGGARTFGMSGRLPARSKAIEAGVRC